MGRDIAQAAFEQARNAGHHRRWLGHRSRRRAVLAIWAHTGAHLRELALIECCSKQRAHQLLAKYGLLEVWHTARKRVERRRRIATVLAVRAARSERGALLSRFVREAEQRGLTIATVANSHRANWQALFIEGHPFRMHALRVEYKPRPSHTQTYYRVGIFAEALHVVELPDGGYFFVMPNHPAIERARRQGRAVQLYFRCDRLPAPNWPTAVEIKTAFAHVGHLLSEEGNENGRRIDKVSSH